MDDNKQFWERFSRHYAGFMRRSQATYQQICKAMRPFLKRDMDVLELACGTGQLSIPLSPCVRSWEATDFSSEMIRQAKKQVYSSRLHFSVQDATKLPYGPESFDAVVISNALHVMPHPEKALAEAWRVLKPGGWLFAPTFVWGKSRSARLRLWFIGLSGFRVYHVWTAGELMAYLSERGYSIVRHQLLGSSLAPLCCLIARRIPDDMPERYKQKFLFLCGLHQHIGTVYQWLGPECFAPLHVHPVMDGCHCLQHFLERDVA